MSENTMLITGVSSGLGKALADEALRQGWRVVGTVRKETDRQNFKATNAARAIDCILDLTDTEAVPKVVAEVETAIGAVDVLINNAGYGLFATIEDAPLKEVRFDRRCFVGAKTLIRSAAEIELPMWPLPDHWPSRNQRKVSAIGTSEIRVVI
jgi:NAD(P)-dependent dehydrogenase (short-subunit alcohol dehydrogenase family)